MQFFKQISWRALLITLLFLIAYSTLGLVKHNHFLSGYDLAIVDQIMWKYGYFHNPLTTIQAYPFTYLMTDHIEFIYIFLSPLYWIWNDVHALIFFQAFFFCLSGLPIYALARKKVLNEVLSLTLLFSYLFFYGVQNALWNDVHSNVFGAGFLAWLIYFLETKNYVATFVSFFFAITSKEDMAFLTLGIGATWLLQNTVSFLRKQAMVPLGKSRKQTILLVFQKIVVNNKTSLALIFFSLLYLFLVFVVYFPHFTPEGYRFAGNENMASATLHLNYFANTPSKREIILVSLGWFGFLPSLAPIFLIPPFMDLYHFFVIGNLVESAQEIFLHYRVTLAPLLIWSTILGITTLLSFLRKQGSRNKESRTTRYLTPNNVQYVLAVYLLLCAVVIQYVLHLPLSYLAKSWFWGNSPSIATVNQTLQLVPKNASIVSQNNIAPHIAHRDNIFTLWPDVRTYKTASQSPCGKTTCRWFHWVGNPRYMIVDIGPDWDIRHFLANRQDYLEALQNFEHMKKIHVYKREGTTTLYIILQKP